MRRAERCHSLEAAFDDALGWVFGLCLGRSGFLMMGIFVAMFVDVALLILTLAVDKCTCTRFGVGLHSAHSRSHGCAVLRLSTDA